MSELEKINRAAILGGYAYLVELTMRLFAHRTKHLENLTHESTPTLEREFMAHFKESFGAAEPGKISGCRDFRNELLHSTWWCNCTDEVYKTRFSGALEVVGIVRRLTGLSALKMQTDSPNEIDWASLDFAECHIIRAYRDVAVAATAYEIVMRRFANDISDLKAIAYDPERNLETLQKAIGDHLQFTPDTIELLENCRKARNKILHCDFKAAKEIAKKLAPSKVRASGHVLVLDGTKNWESQLVSDSSKKQGGPFGWALEGLSSGAAEATFEALSAVAQKLYKKDFVRVPRPDASKTS